MILSSENKTYRVHNCFRDLIKGWWEDVLELRAVDQGVSEVDESSVINYKHREARGGICQINHTITDRDHRLSINIHLLPGLDVISQIQAGKFIKETMWYGIMFRNDFPEESLRLNVSECKNWKAWLRLKWKPHTNYGVYFHISIVVGFVLKPTAATHRLWRDTRSRPHTQI